MEFNYNMRKEFSQEFFPQKNFGAREAAGQTPKSEESSVPTKLRDRPRNLHAMRSHARGLSRQSVGGLSR